MSEPDSPVEQPQVAAAHQNPVARIIGRMTIMQMILAVVLVVFLWQWFDSHRQISAMQQELARRLAEIDGASRAGQVLASQGLESARELAARIGALEARNVETQSQRAALEALYQDLSASRDEMVLADVEQLLMIAGQHLQLSANVKAALIALQQADERLKRLDRPALSGLRAAIGADMEKLRALPDVDVAAIYSRLDELIIAVDSLPLEQEFGAAKLRAEETLPDVQQSDTGVWQSLVLEIWEEAKSLVRIEDTSKDQLPLLAPSQSFFLRENLKLRLLSAKLALLSRDEASFRHDLQLAQAWLTRYFAAKSSAVTQAIAHLQRLRQSTITIEVPDVNTSLDAVQNFRVSLGKAAK